MYAPIIERIVGFCARHAAIVVLVSLIGGVAAGFYCSTHFRMNSDTESMISSATSWRKRQAIYDADFPQQNKLIDIVIDGATPERAEEAAEALMAALRLRPDAFHSVHRPDGGSYFGHEGLLFLSVDDLKSTTQQLVGAQPFLGGLAADPSLRGIMDSLSNAMQGVAQGQARLGDLSRPMRAFATTLEQVLEGKPSFLPWRALVSGKAPSSRETRLFIEAQPVLEFESLTPGGRASGVIHEAVRRLRLLPEEGVRVRLTGPIPISDEEFQTLTERAGLMVTLMTTAVLAMLWLAVRSFRLIVAILVTVALGLSVTTAIGLAAIGTFNVISVAFIALFVGLGVDFGIQFCVRYRAERHELDNLDLALRNAGGGVGNALTLAAAAAAAGFFSFLPTSYEGVAELGFIAGIGMLVIYVLSISLLPALLKLLAPGGEPAVIGYRALAPLDRFLRERRGFVRMSAAVLGVAGLALLPALRFDFNPLDLRNPKAESVATALDLTKNSETSPNTINVLATSRDAASKRAMALAALPLVSQVLSIDSFIPDDQQQKLAIIQDVSALLDPTLNPFLAKPRPTDQENVASLTAAAQTLNGAAATAGTAGAREARQLARVLDSLAHGTRAVRLHAEDALVPGLQTMLGDVRASLRPHPLTLTTLPADFVRDWVTPNGTFRLQVFPRGDSNNDSVIKEFTREVRAIAPDAVGAPISIEEAGTTIVRAFIQAGILSFLSITILLVVALRRLEDVAIALGPLILAGILTLGTCAAIGLDLNFANIIALPLLFGIGVAFDIYFVMAWRSGTRRLLQSPLTRAVILSAGTTASAFGTLWLSSHPGTASMGELLAISLFWILATVLFLLPAMLAQATLREGLPETV